jgi:hypothetical protein
MEKIPPRLLLLLCKIVVDEFKNGWNTSKGEMSLDFKGIDFEGRYF